MAAQRQLIAVSAVSRKDEAVVYAQIGNFPVAKLVKIFGGLISCQQVVVINVNGLVGVLAGFPNQYIGSFSRCRYSITGSFWRE